MNVQKSVFADLTLHRFVVVRSNACFILPYPSIRFFFRLSSSLLLFDSGSVKLFTTERNVCVFVCSVCDTHPTPSSSCGQLLLEGGIALIVGWMPLFRNDQWYMEVMVPVIILLSAVCVCDF